MSTERLVAIAALVFSVLTAVVAGTWIAGTTLATQDQVHRAVIDGVQSLATKEDVARQVAELATKDDVAELVADAVKISLVEAIAPLATKEDLTALATQIEAFDRKTDALTDCIIDLEDPLRQMQIIAGRTDLPERQSSPLPADPFDLPNSCRRARELTREPPR